MPVSYTHLDVYKRQHPHRGFETITYMLEGRMRHEDHLGNVGLLGSGGVQWMTAARGIIPVSYTHLDVYKRQPVH